MGVKGETDGVTTTGAVTSCGFPSPSQSGFSASFTGVGGVGDWTGGAGGFEARKDELAKKSGIPEDVGMFAEVVVAAGVGGVAKTLSTVEDCF